MNNEATENLTQPNERPPPKNLTQPSEELAQPLLENLTQPSEQLVNGKLNENNMFLINTDIYDINMF